MNFRFVYFFLLLFVVISCKDDKLQQRINENIKDTKKKEIIFSNISKGWIFNATPINEASQANKMTWAEWRLFLDELAEKPKNSIGAFQKKSAELSKKVMALENTVPPEFNKPQLKSRIAILTTKVRMLDLYIHLDNIPDRKVVEMVKDINVESFSLQNQMEKMVQKSKIPLEQGESELLKMLDTTRAIPNVMPDPNKPRIE